MRNYVDPWQNIIDIRGKYLVGRLTFLEPNTSGRKLTIYDTDGNELDNPIYTSTFGLPRHQIMLLDQDYKVTYEMYIGQGNMESDDNEENWMLYKTVLSVNGNLSTEHDSATPTFVNTVDELKQIGGQEDGDTAILKGYYEVGDSGEPRMYVWRATGNWTDDGGVIIRSNNTTTGAWVMAIPSDYIDVRWYGDIPDTSVNPTRQTSNLGQRTRAAIAANRYDKNLYFPTRQTTTSTLGCYIFDGSNTISVDQDIICDSSVRFVVKHDTTGTAVTCKELRKPSKHLFVSEGQSIQIGGYTLTADWINTSWLNGNDTTARNARVGYVIDQLKSPLIFTNTKIKVARDGINMACTFTNCEIVECYKQITTTCAMNNMTIHTDWFADDYNYTNLTITGCKIVLQNCKDANTYILLKNKQLESDYGDLGEQSINCYVLAGGTIENCYGSVTFASHGNTEFHNVSLTVNGVDSTDSFNAVDSWLTLGAASVMSGLQLRRGSLSGLSLQILTNCYIEGASINCVLTTLGATAEIRNSDINALVDATDITLTNNQIYASVRQRDNNGIINVKCTGNMFHLTRNGTTAQHYIAAITPESIVRGVWIGNGSSYDTDHWIKLDRTNLKVQDNDHQYTYAKNAEPYLMKWSGRNRPLKFKKYGGYWTSRATGVGIYSTTTIPFIFLNYRDRKVYAVPRQLYWKAFTVGRGYLARSGRIMSTPIDVGILEGDYNDHRNGEVDVQWSWGCARYQNSTILDNKIFGAAQMVSRDGTGIAEYNVSFEQENAVHGEYSYGIEIGNLPSTDWDSGSDRDAFATYPSQSNGNAFLFIMLDPDFSTGTNPGEVG